MDHELRTYTLTVVVELADEAAVSWSAGNLQHRLAQRLLRLEKGHVIVGFDTELDTTPRRIGMDWAARMEKPDFVGKAALERTAKLPDERRLFGFTMPLGGPIGSPESAPAEGSPILADGEVVGHVSGSWASPLLGNVVMLGWQKHAPFRERVTIDGREAVVTPTPFYDPESRRARA
jgi:sarcosine oxidase subunit alpha